MAIPEPYILNFETLSRAFENKDVALMEGTDKQTGKPVYVICAVSRIRGGFDFVPLAKMFDGNPYEEVDPPPPGEPDARRQDSDTSSSH